MAHPHNQRIETDKSSLELSNPQIFPNDLLNPFGGDFIDPRASSSNKPQPQNNAADDFFFTGQRSANVNPHAHDFQGLGHHPDYDPELNHILEQMGRSKQGQQSRNEPKSRFSDPMLVSNPDVKPSKPNKHLDDELFNTMGQLPIGRSPNRKDTTDFVFGTSQPTQSQTNQPLNWNPLKASFGGGSFKEPEPMYNDAVDFGGYNAEKNTRAQEKYFKAPDQIERPNRLQSLEPLRPSMAKLLPKDAIGEYERLEKSYCASPYPAFNIFVTVLINIGCIAVLCSVTKIESNEGKLCFILSCMQINTEVGLYVYGVVTLMLFTQYICYFGTISYKNRNTYGLYWLFAVYVVLVLCALIRGAHELTILFGLLSVSLGKIIRQLFYMEEIKVSLGDRASELEHGEVRRRVRFGDDDWTAYNVFWPNKISKLCQSECLWSGLLDILLVSGVFLVFYILHLFIK